MFKKAVLAMALGFASLGANASLTDCNNLFVRSFMASKTSQSEVSVIFGESPSGGSVSLNVFFADWELNRRKDILALLMSAKATESSVTIRTNGPEGCDITSGYRVVEDITFH